MAKRRNAAISKQDESTAVLVTRAATLRAMGHPWKAIARKLGRKPHTCEGWMNRYPDQWKAAFEQAAANAIASVRQSGMDALRRQESLAEDEQQDPRVRQAANHSIMALWKGLEPEQAKAPSGETYEEWLARTAKSQAEMQADDSPAAEGAGDA